MWGKEVGSIHCVGILYSNTLTIQMLMGLWVINEHKLKNNPVSLMGRL